MPTDQEKLNRAAPVIHECEYLLEHHHTIALDNIAPETDFVWPTQLMMQRAGMRVVTSDNLNGRPFLVVDCRNMGTQAKAIAETKRRMLAQAYDMRLAA